MIGNTVGQKIKNSLFVKERPVHRSTAQPKTSRSFAREEGQPRELQTSEKAPFRMEYGLDLEGLAKGKGLERLLS